MEQPEKALTLLLYNDPALIGMLFGGLTVISERNQQVLPALMVSPMSLHTYLWARLLPLALIGWGCSLGMAVAFLGFQLQYLWFSLGIISTVVVFGLAGFWLVSFTGEFLLFLLRSIPILMGLSVPLLNYYGITDVFAFHFWPTQGGLDLLLQSYPTAGTSATALFVAIGSVLGWVSVLYLGVYLTYRKRFSLS
jgi:fluoroquinolone transport system permease protein